MNGETNLNQLLAGMQPSLQEGDYVFCSIAADKQLNTAAIIGLFREKEGVTVIVEKKMADKLQLPYSFVAAWITLTVHSSLEAVGLTAAFSNALANAGISCNVIAAFYHDHIFVARNQADLAMQVLSALSAAARG